MQMESSLSRTDSRFRQAIHVLSEPIAIALMSWVTLVVVAFVWGSVLNRTAPQDLGAPPLFGHFGSRLSAGIVVICALAVVIVRWWGRVALHLRWRPLLAVTWASTLAWTLALNTISGFHQLAAPISDRFEYRTAVSSVGTPVRFLATFVTRLPRYPIHVQGHPPAMVLVLWALQQIGFGAPGWEATVVIAAGTSSVVAALLVCRSVGGEASARRALPFLILAPMALWIATSADALFLGVSAWGLALFVLAVKRAGGAGQVLAIAGGSLFGISLLLSYGVLALAIVPLTVGIRTRVFRKATLFFGAALVMLGLVWAAGFSWWDGLEATRKLYSSGIAEHRSYLFFILADLAAFAIVIGPAGAAGLATLRNKWLWVIVGATVIAVVLSDLSGYSKGEVERIWLPFAPWILIATSELPDLSATALLSLQAVVGIAIAIGVRTAW